MKLPMKKMIMASVAGIRIEITSEQVRLFLNDAEVTIFLNSWRTKLSIASRMMEAITMALKDISLTIKQGEKIAIVGASGSGKSIFVNLLCGMYEPKEGIYARLYRAQAEWYR